MSSEKPASCTDEGSIRGRFMQQLVSNLDEIRAMGRNLCHLYDNVDYESYWTGADWLNVDQLEHTVVRQLLPATGYRLVDIGCGYGRLADCYLDRFEQAVLLDSSPSLLGQAMERTGGRAACVVADLSHLPFRDGSFDATLMVRVFHHVEDCTGCLRELSRVLSSKGCLVLNYRNKRDLLSIIRWLRKKSAYNPFNSEPVEESFMLTAHHPLFVDRVMQDAGFRVTRFAGTTGALVRLAGKVHRARLGLAVSIRVATLFGRAKLTPWVFCHACVADGALKESQPDET